MTAKIIGDNSPAQNHNADTFNAAAQQQTAQQYGGRVRVNRAIVRGRTGDALSALKVAMDNIITETHTEGLPYQHRIIPLDGSAVDTHFSSLVVTCDINVGGRSVTTCSTLIVEASNTLPAPLRIQLGNISYEQLLTTGDAWDNRMWEKVHAAVSKTVRPGTEIINAGALVVPNDLQADDVNAVNDILWAATQATVSIMETQFPEVYAPYNVKEALDSNSKIVAHFDEQNVTETVNELGLPIRSDIAVNVIRTQNNQHQNQNAAAFQHNATSEICQAFGFVDLVRELPPPPQPGVLPVTQQFRPRVVVTKLAAAVMTPETVLLALANMFLSGNQYMWAGAFYNGRGNEMTDIGALGYTLANPSGDKKPARIDTKSNKFTHADFVQLMHSMVHANPVYSLDCEDVGADSWVTNLFVAAAITATENPQAPNPANDMLIRYCDNLTNGGFSQQWGNQPICKLDQNRIHLGTYVDEAGQTRDLRDLDNVAVLSKVGGNNIETYWQWCSSFDDANVNIGLRLDTRYQIIRRLLKSVRIRGMAERVNINPSFPGAICAALAANGYRVEVQGLTPLIQQNMQHGNTTIAQFAVVNGGNGMQWQNGPAQNSVYRPYNQWS